jgi:hypothetical protein
LVVNVSILRPVPKQVVYQNQGHHGLGDRCGSNSNTGVVPPFGDDFDAVSMHIDTLTWYRQT